MNQVFISHSHEDSDFAENLHNKLTQAKFTVWRDTGIRAGEDWRREIDLAVKESFALVVVMTPEAKASEYVTYEWAFAWGAGVKVIPVLLKTTDLHPRLESLQYLDFTNRGARPWDTLVELLREAELAKPSGEAAPRPDRREGADSFPLEPKITGKLTAKQGSTHLKAIARLKNLGSARVTLEQKGTALIISTIGTQSSSSGGHEIEWTDLCASSVFEAHHWIEPGETIEDQKLFVLPGDNQIARIRLRLVCNKIEWNGIAIVE
jgi:hypothetical protein